MLLSKFVKQGWSRNVSYFLESLDVLLVDQVYSVLVGNRLEILNYRFSGLNKDTHSMFNLLNVVYLLDQLAAHLSNLIFIEQ